MSSPANPFVIDTKRDWVHWIGDSLVEYLGNTPPGGGIAGPLMWQIHGQQAINYAPAIPPGYPAVPPTDSTQSYLMPFTQNGASGTGIKNISDNLTTRVITPLTNGGMGRSGRAKLILEASVNDGGVSSGPGTWDTYFPGIMSNLRAAFGTNLDVLILPVLFSGDENWTAAAGGSWAGATNISFDGANAHYQTLAGTYGCWWIDWRGLTLSDVNSVLYQESLVNTGHASTDVFTVDGVHPKCTFGEKVAITALNNFLDIRY